MGQTVGNISKKKNRSSYCWNLGNHGGSTNLCRSPNFNFFSFTNPWFLALNKTDGTMAVCNQANRATFSFDVTLTVKYSTGTEIIQLENVKKTGCFHDKNTDVYILQTIETENLQSICCKFTNVQDTCGIVHDKGLFSLSSDIRELLVSEEDSDVTIQVGDQKFPAHKIILQARSPVLQAMLKHDVEKNRGVLDIPDCDPCIFRDFLRFLYVGKLDDISPKDVFELYRISDKYDVKALKMDCVDFILGNLNVDIISDVLSLASKHCETQLLSQATEFFVENAKDILPRVSWQRFVQENPIQANELFIKAFR